MNSKKSFFKELSFLVENYDFEFSMQSKGIDEKYFFTKKNFEIGFVSRTSQFDYLCYFYYKINYRETILNVDNEFYKMFKTRSNKNYFWQLGMIVKEQLKENKIFNYYI